MSPEAGYDHPTNLHDGWHVGNPAQLGFDPNLLGIAAAQTVEFLEDIEAALDCVADIAAHAESEGASTISINRLASFIKV
jgi:hypothetical protein